MPLRKPQCLDLFISKAVSFNLPAWVTTPPRPHRRQLTFESPDSPTSSTHTSDVDMGIMWSYMSLRRSPPNLNASECASELVCCLLFLIQVVNDRQRSRRPRRCNVKAGIEKCVQLLDCCNHWRSDSEKTENASKTFQTARRYNYGLDGIFFNPACRLWLENDVNKAIERRRARISPSLRREAPRAAFKVYSSRYVVIELW